MNKTSLLKTTHKLLSRLLNMSCNYGVSGASLLLVATSLINFKPNVLRVFIRMIASVKMITCFVKVHAQKASLFYWNISNKQIFSLFYWKVSNKQIFNFMRSLACVNDLLYSLLQIYIFNLFGSIILKQNSDVV